MEQGCTRLHHIDQCQTRDQLSRSTLVLPFYKDVASSWTIFTRLSRPTRPVELLVHGSLVAQSYSMVCQHLSKDWPIAYVMLLQT